jgi:hypothetical protein
MISSSSGTGHEAPQFSAGDFIRQKEKMHPRAYLVLDVDSGPASYVCLPVTISRCLVVKADEQVTLSVRQVHQFYEKMGSL